MSLPVDFQFSQASLQDYRDCARRFQLRYVEGVAWPAPQAQPMLEHECHMRRGEHFHRMVQQYLLGIPESRLVRTAGDDEDLLRWWEHFQTARPTDKEGYRYVEQALAATVSGHRLVAKYDLILLTPAKGVWIFDWKTAKRPKDASGVAALFERMQTRVYCYLLVSAGAYLNQGQPILPQEVLMSYWFAESPDDPVRFAYNASQYQEDAQLLDQLITEISSRNAGELWELTGDVRRCRFCPYRSLCDRGEAAGRWDMEEGAEVGSPPEDFDLDFEQIAEIEF